MKRILIKVQGLVQGVGFRPFVYNLALSHNLKGLIINSSEGVFIDVEGSFESLNQFLYALNNNPLPLAKIEKISFVEEALINYSDFNINKSIENHEKTTLISPDIATCFECIREIKDPLNRRYNYPFTNCTNCGPRFSLIKSLPYDRPKTTMKKFHMCKDCQDEYSNPLNRRFHAEPNACTTCGPYLWLTNADGIKLETSEPIKWTIEKLLQGKIFAIKGLGGFHLVCNGNDFEAIGELRIRKTRQHQPFAVMMKDLETIKENCFVSASEEALLMSMQKPIVLLNKKHSCKLPVNIAPNEKNLGVMLPYTPLQQLLFSDKLKILIMTSANVHGLPLEFDNSSALQNLSKIADFFLLHNRDIHFPVDDSIARVVDGYTYILRRARGYVPEPVFEKDIFPILACGANMKNTFCISKQDYLFLSQHNGDLEYIESYNQYVNNIEHFKKLFSFSPKYVACDIHPNYISTLYAESLGLPIIKVQHHHAHIASCMAENNIKDTVIGIAFDGTGYGTDGKVWGGEFFICDRKTFKRYAHLDYIKMPGGSKAIEEPWRMAVAQLFKGFENGLYTEATAKNIAFDLYGSKALSIWSVLNSDFNCLETSSMGRFFDTAASIIGVRDFITYEGQASIELEALLPSQKYREGSLVNYNYEITGNNYGYVIELSKTIKELLEDKFLKTPADILSLKFHNTIISFTVEICEDIRKSQGLNTVCLSGGVFQNIYLLSGITRELENRNFIIYVNKIVPTNDGGIALGQIIVANEYIKGGF